MRKHEDGANTNDTKSTRFYIIYDTFGAQPEIDTNHTRTPPTNMDFQP